MKAICGGGIRLKTIGIGDNVCDKYRHFKTMYPGGQAMNFAVYTKMLGFESAFIGAFGSDAVAEHNQKTLDKLGVDSSRCRHYEGENGYAIVDVIDGERVFIRSNKGGVLRLNPLELTGEDLDYISEFNIIHTSNNSYIEPQLPKLASLGPVLSFDFSGSWKDDAKTADICKHVDFAFMSCSKLSEAEAKEQLRATHRMGVSVSVATRGGDDAYIFDGKRFFTSTPDKMEAVDTLGAGDSFAAAFITAFVERVWGKESLSEDAYAKAVNDCLEGARRMAARTCMMMGAFGEGTDLV